MKNIWKNILNNLGVSQRSIGKVEDDGTVTITKILSYDLVSNPGFSKCEFLTEIDFSEIKRQRLLNDRKEKINKLNNIK